MPSRLTLTRRALFGAAVALGACPAKVMAQQGGEIIAGTYARRGGPGLVRLEASPNGWAARDPMAAISNASFGVRSAAGIRYLVNEQAEGSLGIYTPGLHRIAEVSTLGADPCHVALSADGRALAVANYSSGSVALWQLDARTGLPLGAGQRIPHAGSGPNTGRQASAHAHWVGFAAGRPLLHAVDLGADAILAHHLDPRSGAWVDTSIAYRAEPGSGPRHLARHPQLPIAFLVAELTNTVTILHAHANGSFSAGGVVSTLPAGFTGPSAAAHIAVNRSGDRVYVSNRGHDSIAVLAVGKGGALRLLQHIGCGGHWPRMFLLLEDRGEMLVANERSGNIAAFRVARDGTLRAAASGVAIPRVVYLAT